MTVFTFIHKNFQRAKLKISRLITLAEISRQPNIDFVAWLLVVIFIYDYNEKEQSGQT